MSRSFASAGLFRITDSGRRCSRVLPSRRPRLLASESEWPRTILRGQFQRLYASQKTARAQLPLAGAIFPSSHP